MSNASAYHSNPESLPSEHTLSLLPGAHPLGPTEGWLSVFTASFFFFPRLPTLRGVGVTWGWPLGTGGDAHTCLAWVFLSDLSPGRIALVAAVTGS